MRKIILASAVITIFFIAGCSSGQDFKDGLATFTIYKSSSCGCCGNYVGYMKNKDFNIKVSELSDISPMKMEYGVPSQMESCHTSVVEGYFVEGHVPVEAINKLLQERPDIKGIAMPGMPSGSPGMPGSKKGDFLVYSVMHDGSYKEFMRM